MKSISVRDRMLILAIAAMTLPSLAQQGSGIQQQPSWVAEYGYRPQGVEDFAFGVQEAPEVPIVIVTIQGKPLSLIFDTGTAGYATLDSQVISDLQLPVKSWTTWLDSSGKPVAQIPRAIAHSVQFGPIHLTDLDITGMGPEGIMGKRKGFVGTLGWWSFRDYRVTLDYANRKIALSRSPLPPQIRSCATRYVTPFVSPSDLDGLVLVEGKVSGTPIYLQVDTGKSSTELDPKIQAIREFKKESQGYVIDAVTVGPFVVQSRFGRMFGSLEGLGHGLGLPVYVGLGSDFLKSFLVTIDYISRSVVLEQKPCESSR